MPRIDSKQRDGTIYINLLPIYPVEGESTTTLHYSNDMKKRNAR